MIDNGLHQPRLGRSTFTNQKDCCTISAEQRHDRSDFAASMNRGMTILLPNILEEYRDIIIQQMSQFGKIATNGSKLWRLSISRSAERISAFTERSRTKRQIIERLTIASLCEPRSICGQTTYCRIGVRLIFLRPAPWRSYALLACGSMVVQIKAVGCGGHAAATDSKKRYFRSAEGSCGVSRTKMNPTRCIETTNNAAYTYWSDSSAPATTEQMISDFRADGVVDQ